LVNTTGSATDFTDHYNSVPLRHDNGAGIAEHVIKIIFVPILPPSNKVQISLNHQVEAYV
jgi:hypothetical protein